MGRPPTNLPRVTFRFPEELRTHLEEAAKANNRSVNAEVVARLQASFSDESITEFLTVNNLRAIIDQSVEEAMEQYKKVQEKKG